jgi:glycosyltransferase involved in cell wall biosynthesis
LIKRILAISNHGIMLGGGEHSFLDLISHLPHVWKPFALVPYEGELQTRLSENGIETHVIPLPSIRPWFIHNIFACLRSYFVIRRKYRPDLIYANGSRAAFYGGLAGKLLGLPVVWHCRIADKDPCLDFLLVRMSDFIVANSHATARRFGSRWKNKITVVHNGVDIEWLADSSVKKPDLISENWKVIICVARVSRWKRHDLVLKAFEKVAMQEPDAHLFFIGGKDIEEPEWWNYLQVSTQRSRYSDRIHWIGKVNDARPWYKAAHLLVLGSENEPFGRVLVEAMACGVPIVATKSGGIPEIIRHGQDGLLVPPGNEVEMAEAIAKMMKDESFRKRISDSARGRASLFSLDKHVDRMVRIFEEIISRH